MKATLVAFGLLCLAGSVSDAQVTNYPIICLPKTGRVLSYTLNLTSAAPTAAENKFYLSVIVGKSDADSLTYVLARNVLGDVDDAAGTSTYAVRYETVSAAMITAIRTAYEQRADVMIKSVCHSVYGDSPGTLFGNPLPRPVIHTDRLIKSLTLLAR